MITIKVKVTPNRTNVKRALTLGRVEALHKIGRFVSQGAKRLVGRRASKRKRATGGASEPGQPPMKHTGDIANRIRFEYDANAQTMVIGPVIFTRRKTSIYTGLPTRGRTVPHILEHGGTVQVMQYLSFSGSGQRVPPGRRQKWHKIPRSRGRRAPAGARTQINTYMVQPRPFMAPSLDKERRNNKLAEAWRNVVR